MDCTVMKEWLLIWSILKEDSKGVEDNSKDEIFKLFMKVIIKS